MRRYRRNPTTRVEEMISNSDSKSIKTSFVGSSPQMDLNYGPDPPCSDGPVAMLISETYIIGTRRPGLSESCSKNWGRPSGRPSCPVTDRGPHDSVLSLMYLLAAVPSSGTVEVILWRRCRFYKTLLAADRLGT